MKSKRNNIISRIFVVFVCSLLLFVAVLVRFPKKAEASGTLVAGAALIITALASYMAASGVQISSNSNSNASDVVSMWETICAGFESNGKTLESWYGSAGSAVNIIVGKETGEKFAVVSTALSNWFDDLRNWLQGKYNFSDAYDTVMIDSLYLNSSIGNLPVYNSFSEVQSSGVKPQSICGTNIGDSTIIGFDNGYYLQFVFSANPDTGNLAYKSYYILPGFGNVWQTGGTGSNTKIGSAAVFLYRFISGNTNDIRVGYAYQSPYAGNSYYYSSTVLTNFSMPVSSVDGNEITVSGELADGYQDYQDALDQAQSDAGLKGDVVIDTGDWDYAGKMTKEEVAEAYLNRIAVTGTAEGTLTGGYSDEKEAEDETEGEYVPSGAWYEKNFVVVDGLEDFFPFCIPFDFYEIIKVLNVPAEAPKFDWKMNFGEHTGLDDYDIEIDLSPYETVAIVFRVMFIIGFLVFLTLKTRDLIRG